MAHEAKLCWMNFRVEYTNGVQFAFQNFILVHTYTPKKPTYIHANRHRDLHIPISTHLHQSSGFFVIPMNNKPKNYNLSFFGVKIGIIFGLNTFQVTQYGQGHFAYKKLDDFSWKFIKRLLAQDMMCIKFMEFSNWNERPTQAFMCHTQFRLDVYNVTRWRMNVWWNKWVVFPFSQLYLQQINYFAYAVLVESHKNRIM